MEPPSSRLRAWREAADKTLDWLAKEIGCDWTALSHIERGTRNPGRRIANGIESVTGGLIRSTDWDAWEDEQKRLEPPTKTGTED